MGIIRFFRQLIAFRKLMKELPNQIAEQNAEYLNMRTEDLSNLPDEDLFAAAISRAECIVDRYEELIDGFLALNEHQKVVYAVNYLEMEVNNGGLCQFFVNSSRAIAPYISNYLGIIHAKDHKELFDGFIERNQIQLDDLSSFQIRRARDFEKQAERYPFEEYDDAFYELDTLETPLTAYIRAHIEAF